MSDTIAAEHVSADVPEYPMERAARCPFAPPSPMLEMGQAKPLSRVRIWNGTTPWLITGHEVARALFSDSRVSVDDRREGFPHWNEHMLSTVNKRPRSVFTSDAEEHTRFRRMLSKPFTFKRVEASARGDPGEPPISASTRSWPAHNRPTSSPSWRCRCRPR